MVILDDSGYNAHKFSSQLKHNLFVDRILGALVSQKLCQRFVNHDPVRSTRDQVTIVGNDLLAFRVNVSWYIDKPILFSQVSARKSLHAIRLKKMLISRDKKRSHIAILVLCNPTYVIPPGNNVTRHFAGLRQ